MVISVLSGKGGTGKTTVVAALSELIEVGIQVDCDVDAPNLYLFYHGVDRERESFFGSKRAWIDESVCTKCESCKMVCRFGAIQNLRIDPLLCEGCGACVLVCPQHAIQLEEEKTADVYLTENKTGILSRARMEIGSDGSGKLVTKLRKNAAQFADNRSIQLIDGSPGIGCSVMASIANNDITLIVTEPTQSGLADLRRIFELTKHFDTSVMICVNKFDVNPGMTEQMEMFAKEMQVQIVGKIPFDPMVMEAVNTLKPITQFYGSTARKAIEAMWNCMKQEINRKCERK
ncbi:MAG: hypothetical protein PWP24_1481 [Clostridiales bacterium]|nr:hypothetical protein [Clostridiales bacterium]